MKLFKEFQKQFAQKARVGGSPLTIARVLPGERDHIGNTNLNKTLFQIIQDVLGKQASFRMESKEDLDTYTRDLYERVDMAEDYIEEMEYDQSEQPEEPTMSAEELLRQIRWTELEEQRIYLSMKELELSLSHTHAEKHKYMEQYEAMMPEEAQPLDSEGDCGCSHE